MPISPAEIENLSPTFQRRKLYIVLKSQEEVRETRIDSGDDIADNIKETFVKHAAQQTLGARNRFPVAATGEQRSYLQNQRDNGNADAATIFETSSHSGQLDTSTAVKFKIRINGPDIDISNIVNPTGDEIYQSIEEERDNAPFARRIQSILLENNRYNSARGFGPINSESPDDAIVGNIASELGAHSPRKFPTAKDPTTELLSIKEMKKIGLLTMLQATGETFTPNPRTTDIALAELTSVITPGLARLGQRINFSRFRANEVVQSIKDVNKPGSKFRDEKQGLSYGNVNSYFAPFAGLTAVASIANATILMVTVGAFIAAFSLMLQGLGRDTFANSNTRGENGRDRYPHGIPMERKRWLGSSRGTATESAGLLGFLASAISFNVVKTDHNFFKCLNKGMKIFFGINESSFLSSVANSTKNVARIHGYYNTVLRAVIRSLTDIGFGVGRAIDEGDSTTVRNAVDPIQIIEKLNSSAAMKFINILAPIGDKALFLENNGHDLATLHGISTFIEDIPEDISVELLNSVRVTTKNPAVLVAKNMLNNGRSSIGNSTIRSLLLVPRKVINGAYAMGTNIGSQYDELETGLNANNFTFTGTDRYPIPGRFNSQLVEKVENYLEACYVPFYFHDIRTNEIISTHAFLENISDGLSAEYNETEGYGRIGSVMTYKNTKRDISFAFTMLATNSSDFDEMWYKINRIASMCYPQYTQGRKVHSNNNKFIQPFSQLPGASPLIRVRLGDVIKGNYSKYAAARLFGLADGIGMEDGSTFNLSSLTADQNAAEAIRRGEIIRREAADTVTRHTDHNFAPNDIVKINGNSGHNSSYALVETIASGLSVPTTNLPVTIPGRGRGRNRPHVPVPALANANAMRGVVVRTETGTNSTIVTYVIVRRVQLHNGDAILPQNSIPESNHYRIPVTSIIPDTTVSQAQARSRHPDAPSNNQSGENGMNNDIAVTNFFSDENNPIMKAFKSTQGRGLAGFIKSLKIDFENARWATETANSRAPMLVKLDVSFSPIHDISPGLDSNGFMTAPIWNVGERMRAMSANTTEFEQQMRSLQTARNALTGL